MTARWYFQGLSSTCLQALIAEIEPIVLSSVQILEGNSDKGASLRLHLGSSGIIRSEDICIPIIKLSGRKNDLYNRRWYCDYVFESACGVLFYFSDQIDPKYTASSYYSRVS